MAGMHHAAPAASAAARRQIEAVARSVAALGTPAAAGAAGMQPVFGWIPTMGVHWVDRHPAAYGVLFFGITGSLLGGLGYALWRAIQALS